MFPFFQFSCTLHIWGIATTLWDSSQRNTLWYGPQPLSLHKDTHFSVYTAAESKSLPRHTSVGICKVPFHLVWNLPLPSKSGNPFLAFIPLWHPVLHPVWFLFGTRCRSPSSSMEINLSSQWKNQFFRVLLKHIILWAVYFHSQGLQLSKIY